MNKKQLEELVDARLAEGKVLLENGLFPGAYYLSGYAAECAIKVCIAKTVQQHDFPDKDLARNSFSHDLGALVKVAGLAQHLATKQAADPDFLQNWLIVKDWSEQKRYDLTTKQNVATDFLASLSNEPSGVIPWLKTFW